MSPDSGCEVAISVAIGEFLEANTENYRGDCLPRRLLAGVVRPKINKPRSEENRTVSVLF